MLNINEDNNFLFPTIRYNRHNSYELIDLRLISNVEQLQGILSRNPSGPVSFWLNKALKQLADQAVKLWWAHGGPYQNLSTFINDVLFKLVIWWIENHGKGTPTIPLSEVKEAKVETEVKEVCAFTTCGHAKAVGYAINKETGKRYPVCEKHLQMVKEYPEKWIIEGEKDQALIGPAPSNPNNWKKVIET